MSDFLTPEMTVVALALLAALSVGALVYAVFYRSLRGTSVADDRLGQVKQRTGIAAAPLKQQDAAARRRKAVQESLRDMEIKERAKARSRTAPPLDLRLQQAGLDITKGTFFIIGGVIGFVFFALGWFAGAPIYVAAGLGVAGVLGFPFWLVNFLRKRRFQAFLREFPNAVDIIVRGVKAGLPLNDSMKIVAAESAEPVRTEFRIVHERQALGQSVADAISEMPERMPLPEANFFAIAIAIQQQAGGNLSEALGNLSKVLRERSKMRGKIKAMSMEAKASAVIIGALPFVVMVLVYLTSPDYLTPLFVEPLGNAILVASAVWMSIGIYVMRKMINFDF